jgi:hypothetical protein
VVSAYCELRVVPPNVTGLELKGQGNDTEFNTLNAHFAWREASLTTATHPAGEEPFGAGTGTRDQWFQDYEVKVVVSGATVRTKYTVTPEYGYTFEMNKDDNGDPERTFTLEVRARDNFNETSPNPARLTVTNPQTVLVPDNITASKRSVTIVPDGGGAQLTQRAFVAFDFVDEPDIAGYAVNTSSEDYDGPNNSADLRVTLNNSQSVWVGAYDVYSMHLARDSRGITWSDEITF